MMVSDELKRRIADHLAKETPPPAIILVDGEEFIVLDQIEGALDTFRSAQTEVEDWREIALIVYKPNYGGYLRSTYTSRG